MPSSRRVRILGFSVACIILTILYFNNDARRSHSQDFYHRTIKAMDAEAAAKASDQEISQKLKEAGNAAKEAVKVQIPVRPEIPLVADAPTAANGEKSVAGRKKMKGGEKWDMATGKEAAMVVDKEDEKKEQVETEKDHDVELELNGILKRGPIIIFSKSYCPYSRKAKAILMDKYNIVPAPFVLELDEHPLGQELQGALEKTTSRRTVPNVLINGRSIGGGDDIEALDTSGELIDKIKKMGGKRIMEMKLRVEQVSGGHS